MKKLILFCTAIVFAMLTVCGQSANKDWKTLKQGNYSIQYPDSFELNKSGELGTKFILFSQQASADDLFKENINLFIQDLTGSGLNLDTYTEMSEKQIPIYFTNGNLLESKRIKKENTEYHKLVYAGEQGIYKLKWLQYYWVKKNKAFILTFTAEENQYDNYIDVAEKIMNSFVIK